MADNELTINMPESHVAGVYADFVSLWHTSGIFTLDFAAVVSQPQQGKTRAQVVARVRIPPGQVFEIMKAMERQLSSWEAETGRKPPPSGPAPGTLPEA